MSRNVSAIRITSSDEGAAAANRNVLVVHNVALHESHGTAFGVMRKGRIMPSHRGNALPICTRHLLSKVDTLS
ncbi:hypothetical protein V6N13_132501 [Hibiscus sabdariffa]|uniref:Uncharacterized protein n=1 Tax=Hibiscus sabdariffa TaxID=183260 RepID=A0ABR2PVL1_9ROSI